MVGDAPGGADFLFAQLGMLMEVAAPLHQLRLRVLERSQRGGVLCAGVGTGQCGGGDEQGGEQAVDAEHGGIRWKGEHDASATSRCVQ